MTRAFITSVLVSAWTISAFGCTEDAPSIEIASVVSNDLYVANDALDDLVIRVRYEDPNGDLGGGRVVVFDCRDEAFTSRFRIDPIATDEAVAAGVAIRGEIVVTVADVDVVAPAERPTICTDANAAEDAFCVVVEDAAGNASNDVCTDAIHYVLPDV